MQISDHVAQNAAFRLQTSQASDAGVSNQPKLTEPTKPLYINSRSSRKLFAFVSCVHAHSVIRADLRVPSALHGLIALQLALWVGRLNTSDVMMQVVSDNTGTGNACHCIAACNVYVIVADQAALD